MGPTVVPASTDRTGRRTKFTIAQDAIRRIPRLLEAVVMFSSRSNEYFKLLPFPTRLAALPVLIATECQGFNLVPLVYNSRGYRRSRQRVAILLFRTEHLIKATTLWQAGHRFDFTFAVLIDDCGCSAETECGHQLLVGLKADSRFRADCR